MSEPLFKQEGWRAGTIYATEMVVVNGRALYVSIERNAGSPRHGEEWKAAVESACMHTFGPGVLRPGPADSFMWS